MYSYCNIVPLNCLSYFSFIASLFSFHSCFGRPFDLILIVSTIVEELIELYLFYIFIFNGLYKLSHFHHV